MDCETAISWQRILIIPVLHLCTTLFILITGSGLDNFYDKEDEARLGIINSLNYLNTINTEIPNSMPIQFFFQGKNTELIKTFSKANPDVKKRARDLLMKLDVTNASAYKDMK